MMNHKTWHDIMGSKQDYDIREQIQKEFERFCKVSKWEMILVFTSEISIIIIGGLIAFNYPEFFNDYHISLYLVIAMIVAFVFSVWLPEKLIPQVDSIEVEDENNEV